MSRADPDYSKEFFDLIKRIGDARTKQDEDRIVLNEIRVLKERMSSKDVKQRNMREYLIRMLYVEMLGHDASFGHIQAVKMVSSRNIIEKRIGYLAVCLTLHKDHEFMMLLVNAFQTDLKSDNFLEICMALHAVNRLVNADIIPAVMPLVVSLLTHKQAIVRKKAVVCLQRFHQLNPHCLTDLNDMVLKVLCDSDPSVMGASLVLLKDLIKASPHDYKIITQSLVGILKQIIEHRLPREYDYHRLPAPWLQINILQLLGMLGRGDRKTSELMFDVLADVLRRAAVNSNIGYSIVYQCIRTITSIYPNTSLLQSSAEAIAHFLTSSYHNLKYIGVTALIDIVKIDTQYATQHQMIVMDCLESPDETLQRKTLELLFYMTNPSNIIAIIDIMIKHLQTTTDAYLRSDLSLKIIALCEQYAPSAAWYVLTVSKVLECGGNDVPLSKTYGVINFLTQLAPDDSDPDSLHEIHEVRVGLTNEFISKLQQSSTTGSSSSTSTSTSSSSIASNIPDPLMKTMAWVIGEYGLLAEYDGYDLLTLLLERFMLTYADHTVRHWLMSSMMRIISLMDNSMDIPQDLLQCLQSCTTSQDVLLQHLAMESLALCQQRPFLKHITLQQQQQPSYDDLVVDVELSFLDNFVNAALQKGATAYNPSLLTAGVGGADGTHGKKSVGLRFDAYERVKPTITRAAIPTTAGPGAGVGGGSASGASYGMPTASGNPMATTTAPVLATVPDDKIVVKPVATRGKWGPKGFNNPQPQPQPQQQQQQQQQPSGGLGGRQPPPYNTAVASGNRSGMESMGSSSASPTETSPTTGGFSSNNNGLNFRPRRQPDPAQDPKRQQAANSLFAGLSTTSTSTTTTAKKSAFGGTGGGATKMTFKSNVNLRKTTPATTGTTATPPTAAVPSTTPAAQESTGSGPLDMLFDAASTPPPPASTSSTNLNDILFSSSPSSSTTTSKSSTGTFGIDLLDLTGTSSNASTPPATNNGSGGDAFDLLGIGSASTSASTLVGGASNQSQNVFGLILDGNGDHSSTTSPIANTGHVVPVLKGRESPAGQGVTTMLRQLGFQSSSSSSSHIPQHIIQHSYHQNVLISYEVHQTTHNTTTTPPNSGQVAVVVYITNTSNNPIHHQPALQPNHYSIQLSSSSSSQVQLKAYCGAVVTASSSPTSASSSPSTYDLVKPLNDTTFQYHTPVFTTIGMIYTISSATLLSLPQTQLQLQFHGCNFMTNTISSTKTTIHGNIPLATPELLFPLPIVTKQYAEIWKSLGNATEYKSTLSIPLAQQQQLNVQFTNDYVHQLLAALHIHPVQTIKQETIAASVLVGGTANTPQYIVLLHVKIIDQQTISLHARSKMTNASQGVVDAFMTQARGGK